MFSHCRRIALVLSLVPSLVLTLALLLMPWQALLAADGKLVFAAIDDFKPFSWNDNGVARGIDIDIVRRLSERLDVPIEVRMLPWKRVLLYTSTGTVDGGFPGFHVAEREQFAIYPRTPLHISLYKVFVAKNAPFPFNTVEDLKGMQVGKNLGFRISEEFDAAAAAKLFEVVENDMGVNLRRLAQGRLDAVVGNYAEVRHALKELGLTDDVVDLSTPVRPPRAAYLLISKASRLENLDAWIERIDLTLELMQQEGEIERIYRRYDYDIQALERTRE